MSQIIYSNTSGEYRIFRGNRPRFVALTNKDNLPEDEVYCYPNPAAITDNVTLHFAVREDSNITIEVFTLSGKLIFSDQLNIEFDKEGLYTKLDISNFKTGIYDIVISAFSETERKREIRFSRLTVIE